MFRKLQSLLRTSSLLRRVLQAAAEAAGPVCSSRLDPRGCGAARSDCTSSFSSKPLCSLSPRPRVACAACKALSFLSVTARMLAEEFREALQPIEKEYCSARRAPKVAERTAR